MKQAGIDREINEEINNKNKSVSGVSGGNKKPESLSVVILIIGLFIFLFLIFKPAPQYVINNESLIRETLIKIQTMEEPLPISEEEYASYGMGRGDTPKPNCVDYSFAFAAYYGKDAKIIFNDHHCWIKIGSIEIEPQQDPQDTLKNVAVDRGMNYFGKTRVTSLREKHRKLIREVLGL
jgi:hypothetical protein